MQTLAAGSREATRLATDARGFTLLELLVVLAIVALASAGVSLALRDGTQTQLEREALRLSALLEAARARSQASGVPLRWQSSATGFQFLGLPADASNELTQARAWLNADTRAAVDTAASATASDDVATLLLGPEPITARQSLQLYSASAPAQRLRLASDGLRPFTVTAAP